MHVRVTVSMSNRSAHSQDSSRRLFVSIKFSIQWALSAWNIIQDALPQPRLSIGVKAACNISHLDFKSNRCWCYSKYSSLWFADPECGDVPLLTPGSKEMMSQALKATFSGFTKEQQRLGIPKGKTARCFLLSLVPVNVFIWKLKLQQEPSKNTSVCHISSVHICSSFTLRLSSEDSEKAPLRKTD